MKPITQWTVKDFVEMAKTLDRKTLLRGALVGAGVLVFIWMIVIPAWFERFSDEGQIKMITAQLARFEALRRSKPKMIEDRKNASEFIQKSKDRLYAAGESSLLLGSIAKLAESSKVAIVASSPREQKGEFPAPFNQYYQSALYDFTVEGAYHDLGAFVSKIESNPKILRIQNFQLKPSEEAPEKQIAEISLSATSFKEKK